MTRLRDDESLQTYMILEMKAGKMYRVIFEAVKEKFNWPTMSKRTFNIYWKRFKEIIAIEQQQIREQVYKSQVDEAVSQIASVNERKIILSRIIRGESVTPRKRPTYFDRHKAIAELNKMEGDYAPSKVDHKVEPMLHIAMTPEEIRQISENLEKNV